MSFASKWVLGAVGVVAVFLLGCGSGQPPAAPPADPETARSALNTALDAWKNGVSLDSLIEQSPPIFMADEEWRGSFKLLQFKMEGSGAMQGLAFAIPVHMKVTDPRGQSHSKRAVYRISTAPTISIVREEEAYHGPDNND